MKQICSHFAQSRSCFCTTNANQNHFDSEIPGKCLGHEHIYSIMTQEKVLGEPGKFAQETVDTILSI